MRRVTSDQHAKVSVKLNGRNVSAETEPRMLLSDFIRQSLGATGTHVGCEHGVCGCCTVLLDGVAVRSCLTLAMQADGREITTRRPSLEEYMSSTNWSLPSPISVLIAR